MFWSLFYNFDSSLLVVSNKQTTYQLFAESACHLRSLWFCNCSGHRSFLLLSCNFSFSSLNRVPSGISLILQLFWPPFVSSALLQFLLLFLQPGAVCDLFDFVTVLATVRFFCSLAISPSLPSTGCRLGSLWFCNCSGHSSFLLLSCNFSFSSLNHSWRVFKPFFDILIPSQIYMVCVS